jgi:DNA processing protein
LPDLVRRGGGGPSLLADEASVTHELQIAERFGGRHIFIDDPEYTSLLSHLDNAPPD